MHRGPISPHEREQIRKLLKTRMSHSAIKKLTGHSWSTIRQINLRGHIRSPEEIMAIRVASRRNTLALKRNAKRKNVFPEEKKELGRKRRNTQKI